MVPNGWEVKKLRDVGVCLTGLTYKPENVVSDGLLVLRSSNVQDAQLSFDDNVYVDVEIPEKSKTRYGDILLCVRNGSKRLIGKSAFITKDAEGLAHGAFMGLFRPKSNPEYIFQVFQTDDFYRQVHRNLGATINSINSGNLYDFKFAFPPAPEQQKIAKILTTWDKAINTTERLIENSKQQKKALMQQLLTGQKRLLDDSGQRFSGDWKARKISDFGNIYSGGTPSTTNSTYWDGDIDWITPTDITKQDQRYISSSKRRITKEGLKNSSAKLVPGGSLLVCTRATIGAMAITSHAMCTNQGFKNIVPNDDYDIEFLYYLLSFNPHQLIRRASGSTFLELSKSEFESIKFKTPQLKEQQKIAAVLTNADREIEVLEQQLADLQQEKKALMQQLLTGKKRVLVDM